MAATAYASTKENHPYVKAVLDLAEKSVKRVTDVAASSAQPLLSKLEPQGESAALGTAFLVPEVVYNIEICRK